jgi:hypothetical protein
VIIPSSVASIGGDAFWDCTSLASVYFQGNAPTVGSLAFSGDTATVYLLPGTTGWGTKFGGLTTALWSPPPPAPAPLQVEKVYAPGVGELLVLTWTNSSFSLQAAPTVTGVYTNIPDAASPFAVAPSGRQGFFRLQTN